jgi:hypothetical protein
VSFIARYVAIRRLFDKIPGLSDKHYSNLFGGD